MSMEKIGPHYLEIVRDGLEQPYYVVVQAAPFEPKKVEKPATPKKAEFSAETKHAFGTKALVTDKIWFAEHRSPRLDYLEYAKQNKDYVLVINIREAGNFREFWEPSDYANATAIVLMVEEDLVTPFGTHLGGGLRALDIPVIMINGEPPAILNERVNVRCTFYADEFKGKGAFALERLE